MRSCLLCFPALGRYYSTLRNKGLAEVFYDTELIEQWGSGIEKMRKYCLDAGLPEPTFEEYQGFQVVFRKDIYDEEYPPDLNLNERQIKAVMYVKGLRFKDVPKIDTRQGYSSSPHQSIDPHDIDLALQPQFSAVPMYLPCPLRTPIYHISPLL